MAYPVNRPLSEWALTAHLADITTSGGTAVAYMPVPFRGRLTRVYRTQYDTASGGAAVVTVAINGVAVNGAALTFSTTTGQAGRVYASGDLAAVGTNTGVSEGDVISFTSDGAPTDGTVAANFTAVLRRM